MAVSVTDQNKAWKGDRECRGRELQLQIEWSGKPQGGDSWISGSRVSQAEGRVGAEALLGRLVRLDRVSEGRPGRSEVGEGAGNVSKWDRTRRALWATHCNVCNQISVFLSL